MFALEIKFPTQPFASLGKIADELHSPTYLLLLASVAA